MKSPVLKETPDPTTPDLVISPDPATPTRTKALRQTKKNLDPVYSPDPLTTQTLNVVAKRPGPVKTPDPGNFPDPDPGLRTKEVTVVAFDPLGGDWLLDEAGEEVVARGDDNSLLD